MENEHQIYSKLVPVTKDRHRNLSVDLEARYSYAAGISAVPIAAAEFGHVALECPILFVKNEDAFTPVALTALVKGKNLFVSETGAWTGRYVPAFVRRYPFLLSRHKSSEKLMVCVDEGFAGCNREGKGRALFEADGSESEYFRNMMSLSFSIEKEFAATKEFCARLAALDVLEPATLTYKTRGKKTGHADGFFTVRREVLQKLPKKTLGELAKSGDLEMIHLHLLSLRNLDRLGELLTARA